MIVMASVALSAPMLAQTTGGSGKSASTTEFAVVATGPGECIVTFDGGRSWELMSQQAAASIRRGLEEQSATSGISTPVAVPNPARGSCAIHYSLDREGDIMIALYSLDGRQRGLLREGLKRDGEHSVAIATETLDEGMHYFHILNGVEIVGRGTVMIVR